MQHLLLSLTCDHMKPALKQLHWLLVEQRITYKLCLLMHLIHTRQAPQFDQLYQQFLQPAEGIDWGRPTQRIAFCQEQAPNLKNMVSATLVQPHWTVFLLIYMKSWTLIHSKNGSKVWFLWSPYVIGQTIIFSSCFFLLSFFSSSNLSSRRLDVYHTSTHGVALVRI